LKYDHRFNWYGKEVVIKAQSEELVAEAEDALQKAKVVI
jgi:hypothetical protein